MKKQNLLILAAVVLLTVLPLWLVPYLGIGGDEGELFGGADDKAQQAIATVAPDYQRWFEPLLELNADEQMTDARCNCNFFQQNRLYRGPCQHIVALRLVAQSELDAGRRPHVSEQPKIEDEVT